MYHSQNSNRSTSEGNISVQYNMARSLTLTAQEKLACRPESTRKAYASKANEFVKWANKTFVEENELERSIISGTKLNYFLRDQVQKKEKQLIHFLRMILTRRVLQLGVRS